MFEYIWNFIVENWLPLYLIYPIVFYYMMRQLYKTGRRDSDFMTGEYEDFFMGSKVKLGSLTKWYMMCMIPFLLIAFVFYLAIAATMFLNKVEVPVEFKVFRK